MIRGVRGPVWSGGFGLDDDGLAVSDHDPLAGESLELPGEVAGPALLVDARVVVVGAQVTEPGFRVGQQVVDDDQERVAGGDHRLLFAAAFGDPPVARPQKAVGAGGGGDDVAQRARQPRVALAAALVPLLAGRLVGLGAELGPRHQVRGGGEAAHVDADLGDQLLGGGSADPVTASSWATCDANGAIASAIVVSRAAICSLSRSMLSSIIRRITAWWSLKNPRSASSSAAILARSRRRASWASTLGSRCPATSASSIARPDAPKMSVATELSLICASSSSFSTRCISRVRSRISDRR